MGAIPVREKACPILGAKSLVIFKLDVYQSLRKHNQRDAMSQLFDPGKCVSTVRAKDLLGDNLLPLLSRHLTGDWGTEGKHEEIAPTLSPDELRDGEFATSEGGRLNSIEVIRNQGDRILSRYEVNGEAFYILTHPGRNTTVMLPSEY